ncbi:MAG TPA: YceI family protein [Xanthomonadales bacterium]|nr:YceI family protein [Xanthomonadales bacterium]
MTAAARVLVALLLAGAAHAGEAAATAAQERWRIVARDSHAQFWVRLFGVVPLTGSFPSIDGAISIDRAADRARVEADVAAASVRMRRPNHTAWARSAEFFDAKRHPTIRFESQPFPLSRLEGGGAIEGRLTLRGVTRPVAFSIQRTRCVGIDARSGADRRHCVVQLAGTIDRAAFGMRTRGATVANRVTLRFHIEAAPDPGSAPAATPSSS